MCIALRENHDVSRDEMQRRLISQLDVTLPLGEQMEYDDTLGSRLEYRSG
jgi:hypothetical protein